MTTRDRLAEALPLPPGRSTDWVLDALVPVVDAIAAERRAADLTALTDAARNLDSTVTAYMLGEAGGAEVAQAQARVRRIVHRVLTTPADAAPDTGEETV